MAVTRISLGNIKIFAAEKADMLETVGGVPAVSGFISDVSLLAWINAEFASLWDAMIESSEDYAVSRKMIEVPANIENIPLPKDFYKFRKVFPIESGARGLALKRFDVNDLGRDVSTAYLTASEPADCRYRITGSRLWLHPTPQGPGTLELWYVPMFEPLEQDQDEVPHQFPAGWEDYVTEGVAARMLEKEESDSGPCLRRQEKVLARILRLIEDRDVGEPHRIQDTEGYLDWDNDW